MFSRSRHSHLRHLASFALILSLGACSAPQAPIQLGGSLNILSSGTTIDIDELGDDWVAEGDIPEGAFALSNALGTSTVAITSSQKPFRVIRRVKANLLATPYLSWRWRLVPGKWQYHPVRIVVGFAGGGANSIPGTPFSKLFPGSSLPVYDRLISFLWAPSALMRGNLVQLPDNQPAPRKAQYMVRGGAENVGVWWPETVDLASLYTLSWPTDQTVSARVSFIGISALASELPFTAYVSDLRLSR